MEDRSAWKPMVDGPNDTVYIKKLKNKINNLVDKELALVDFKNEVNKEELAADTLNEVMTRQNFFFTVDDNKRNTNKKVYNLKAPGNKYRKPNAVLDHEHVPIKSNFDVTNLDKEGLMDLYGYYSYIIDLHIAKVRPESLHELSYVPSRYN